MEIKATLQKPYTETQKEAFIIENAHKKGYDIKFEGNELQAWGLTQKEIEDKEQEHISQLSLTKREVFLALYKDKGVTPEQLKAQIPTPEALIEFEYATDYFRGNPLINQIGAMLGYSSEELDYLFLNKELPKKGVFK